MTVQFIQVPPMDEVWKVGNTFYLVRFVFNTDPPIPLVWEVAAADVSALGIGRPTRTLTAAAFAQTGALPMGGSRELLNTTEDPVAVIQSNFDTEVRVRPYLADPEILALWVGASLENRSPPGITMAEFQGTEWWRTHSETERQWLVFNASDPATADRLIADNRLQVADLFAQAGVDNASDDLIQTVADTWTQGLWTEIYAINQVRLLADPLIEGTLDPLLRSFGQGLDTTRGKEQEVRDLVSLWTGPAMADAWTDTNIAIWANRFRENPDAEIELQEILRNQRLALFPEYENPRLTYEDIAAPWRGVFQQVWGQSPDETDPLFTKIVGLNDLGVATQLLRRAGLDAGDTQVTQNFLGGMSNAIGGGVRRSDPAVL